jgi:hypothetical protein
MPALILLICALLVYPGNATARIINVPADQTTIQAGINAASEGDTVLVVPGTYHEIPDFPKKNIVLGSWFLTTQDTTYCTPSEQCGPLSPIT